MARKKAAPPPPPGKSSSSGKPAVPNSSAPLPTVIAILINHGRTIAYVFIAYFLFQRALPALAALTPPGVDAKDVLAAAEDHARAAAAGCADACAGMSCPAGWKTARHAEDPCKCICARVDTSVSTPWDDARKRELAGKVAANGVAEAVKGAANAAKEAADAGKPMDAANAAAQIAASIQQLSHDLHPKPPKAEEPSLDHDAAAESLVSQVNGQHDGQDPAADS